MSAIFGIWNLDGRPVDENHVSKMRVLLSRYGADAQDVYIEGSLAIGCCLNRISSYSRNDAPVMIGPGGKAILAADALIYNREELIGDHKLCDKNSTNNELLWAAYRKWGEDFPKYLNGDFAFAIWENGKLILGRDHLGVRPLYYYFDGAVFVFATDYRAILALPFVPKRIDEKSIYDLLINGNGSMIQDTFFEGVKKALPAHTLNVCGKRLSSIKYWAPGSGRTIKYDTEEEYEKALYDVVLKAIKSRICLTDAKIGSDLSGGLDSSTVALLAGRELKKEGKELSLLLTWAPSFGVFPKQERDERAFIADLCAQEGFDCLYADFDRYISDYQNLDRVTSVEEKPANFICQSFDNARARSISFMLSGWGGDEGVSHRAGLFELLISGCWHSYLKEVAFLSKGSVLKAAKIVYGSTVLTLFKPKGLLSFHSSGDDIANESFNKRMKKYKKRVVIYFGSFPRRYIESGSMQTRTELSTLMGYDVQYLYPFLDRDAMDFALRLPRHMFYKHGVNRYIFRKAFEGILPKGLCYYVPKDDIARYTYFQDRMKELDINRVLMDKLDRNLFSGYIDFGKAEKLLAGLKEKENVPLELQLRRQLTTCYSIQKLLHWADAV